MSVKFILLTDTRSGTMMVTDTLSATYPEILDWHNLYAANPDNPAGSFDVWRRFQDSDEEWVTHRGTTMHRVGQGWIESLCPVGPDELWPLLRDRHDRWVLVHRENILRRYLSVQVGVVTGSYSVASPRDGQPPPVRLMVQELLQYIADTQKLWGVIDKHFPQRLIVTYEDLRDYWEDTFQRIQDYLGLPIRSVPPVTYRQETRGLSEAISNYDEVEHYLRERGYGSWLE